MNFVPSAQYHPDWYAKAMALVSFIWLLAAVYKLFRSRLEFSSDTVFRLTLCPLLLGYSASWHHLAAIASYTDRTGTSDLGQTALALAESQIPALVLGFVGVVVLLTALFIGPASHESIVLQVSRSTTISSAGTFLLAIGAASAALRFRGIPPREIPGFFGLAVASMIVALVCAAMCLPALRTRAVPDEVVRERSRPAEFGLFFAIGLVLILQSSLWHHFMHMVLQYW